ADPFILSGAFWTPRPIQVDEVNHDVLGPQKLGKLIFARRFVAQDHDFGGTQYAFEVGREHGSDVRDDFFNVLAIGASQTAERNVLVPNLDFKALAHETLDQLYLRA